MFRGSPFADLVLKLSGLPRRVAPRNDNKDGMNMLHIYAYPHYRIFAYTRFSALDLLTF